EFDVPRLIGLRIAELSEGGAGKTRSQAAQKMPVGKIEGGASEFQGLLFTPDVEGFADRQVFVQLHGLAKLRDGRGEVTVNHVGRLNKGVLIDIGTRRILRVPTRIQQGLARDQTAPSVAGAEEVLPATDSQRRAALVALYTGHDP